MPRLAPDGPFLRLGGPLARVLPARATDGALCLLRNRLYVPGYRTELGTPTPEPVVDSLGNTGGCGGVVRAALAARPGALLTKKGASGRSKGSIEVAERSLSGVGEKRLRPATRPIHNAGPSMKPQIT